jgi:hypothetical protein
MIMISVEHVFIPSACLPYVRASNTCLEPIYEFSWNMVWTHSTTDQPTWLRSCYRQHHCNSCIRSRGEEHATYASCMKLYVVTNLVRICNFCYVWFCKISWQLHYISFRLRAITNDIFELDMLFIRKWMDQTCQLKVYEALHFYQLRIRNMATVQNFMVICSCNLLE